MKQAIREAQLAFEQGEVPVGAIIVHNNQIIAKAHNQVELLRDVTAHAEILAITSAANHLNSKYLAQCTLFVSLEPCPMCAAALKWSQIGKIVFASEDSKKGYRLFSPPLLHPKTEVEFGLMATDSELLLQSFFDKIREQKH